MRPLVAPSLLVSLLASRIGGLPPANPAALDGALEPRRLPGGEEAIQDAEKSVGEYAEQKGVEWGSTEQGGADAYAFQDGAAPYSNGTDPSAPPAAGKEAIFLHWVDVRRVALGSKVRDRLYHFEQTDPSWLGRVTLWVGETTRIPPDVQGLRRAHGLSIRRLPELLPSNNIGRCSGVRRSACNGHVRLPPSSQSPASSLPPYHRLSQIGKAYALLHATDFRPETVSLIFDGDTQLCNGWVEKAVLPWLSTGKQARRPLAHSRAFSSLP
jgi:hypothetical protein